jgi:hypothetical protein
MSSIRDPTFDIVSQENEIVTMKYGGLVPLLVLITLISLPGLGVRVIC